MILGIGTDILDIRRLKYIVDNPADPFMKMTYTTAEHAEAAGRSQPLYYYATRFAGKEAVFKALLLHPDAIRLDDIEILGTEIGSPRVFLHGQAKELADKRGIMEILLSLSYENDYAIAYAVAQNNKN